MSQKDLDKLVAEALKKHQVQPSPKAWDRVASGLDQKAGKSSGKKTKRRIFGWWGLALLSPAVIWYGIQEQGQRVEMPRVEQSSVSWRFEMAGGKGDLDNGTVEIASTYADSDEMKAKKDVDGDEEEKLSMAKPNVNRQPKVLNKANSTVRKAEKVEGESATTTAVPTKRVGMKAQKLSELKIAKAPILPLAVQPPRKRVSVKIEITIPYKGEKAKPATEPKKGINWQKVLHNILDE